ncbi:hypothetical protein BJF83_01150 [Nocardiopsis sp. CNR-923]|nr:hypothetical protein BJF83_01150 [Nocardiopsis sp. CNR-923]
MGFWQLSMIDCDESLLPVDHWTAIERTHHMESSKLFVPVDRAFWRDKDPRTGRDVMSMTLTDRMTRGTYLLEGEAPDAPAAICMSHTWCDDHGEAAHGAGLDQPVHAALDRRGAQPDLAADLGEAHPRVRAEYRDDALVDTIQTHCAPYVPV